MKRTIKKKIVSLILALTMGVSLVPPTFAAGDQQGDDEGQQSEKIEVTLTSDKSEIKVTETAQLTATVTGTGADTAEVEWTSSNNQVIAIKTPVSEEKNDSKTHTRTVVAISAGTATITVTVRAKDGEKATATYTIKATTSEVTGIQLNKTDISLDVGASDVLMATLQPVTAEASITWSVENEKIATIEENGDTVTVKGMSTGQTKVTAQAGNLQVSCTVYVKGIVLQADTTMKVDDSLQLKWTPYGLGNSPNISWSSDNPAVVQVTTGGYCYALKEGKAKITAQVEGFSYKDDCVITVKTNTAAVIVPDENIVPGETLCFKDIKTDLSNRCSTVLGEGLEYISGLSVSTKEGTLYYKYRSDDDTGRGIAPSDTFYLNPTASRDDLAEVYFLPQPGFSGTATISYTGYAGALSFFQGTIQVEVEEVDHLTYTAAAGVPLQFRAEDFNNVCLNTTGRNLKNVVFTLPDSSRGTLYRNYISATNPGIAVREGDALQYTGTPNLSDVYFVPAVGYDGTVILSYTATDVNGQTFRSRVEIKLTPAAGSGDINYTVSQGGTVSLALQDFKNLCKDFTGGVLDYVRFTLPEASQGTLYFDYTSASKPGTAVTASQNYYANGSPSLGKITFAASASGAGVAAIPFTGWDTQGNNFSGQVEIAIRISGAGDIRYTANSKGEAAFKASDFNDLCKELTGDTLNYVQFTLPASGQGTLYLNYTNSNSTKVTAGQKYYRSTTPM